MLSVNYTASQGLVERSGALAHPWTAMSYDGVLYEKEEEEASERHYCCSFA